MCLLARRSEDHPPSRKPNDEWPRCFPNEHLATNGPDCVCVWCVCVCVFMRWLLFSSAVSVSLASASSSSSSSSSSPSSSSSFVEVQKLIEHVWIEPTQSHPHPPTTHGQFSSRKGRCVHGVRSNVDGLCLQLTGVGAACSTS